MDTLPPPTLYLTPDLERLIDLALNEDLGRGDVTTAVIARQEPAETRILCREPVVACGGKLIEMIIQRSGELIVAHELAPDGAAVDGDEILGRLDGNVDGILRLERTLLNFLMRLCGVATLTRRYVEAVQGTGARIADTRKTLPGWRVLDKYAVAVGGGTNHRADLSAGLLLKDNHIAACGGRVAEAVKLAALRGPHSLRVEVEVENLEMAMEAVEAGAEVLLLDNMGPDEVRHVVESVGQMVLVEVSGGLTLQNVREYAQAGAHILSVGALTHSAPAVDLSLEF